MTLIEDEISKGETKMREGKKVRENFLAKSFFIYINGRGFQSDF